MGGRRSRSILDRLLPIGFALLLFGGVFGGAFYSCRTEAAVRGVARSFLDRLRDDDVAAAYGHLSARRRAAMTLAQFEALTTHPAFRSTRYKLVGIETRADGVRAKHGCVRGHLFVGDDEWAGYLYLVRSDDDDAWFVESFALQAPASVQLGEALEECRYVAGQTDLGYRGPPIVNKTPAL